MDLAELRRRKARYLADGWPVEEIFDLAETALMLEALGWISWEVYSNGEVYMNADDCNPANGPKVGKLNFPPGTGILRAIRETHAAAFDLTGKEINRLRGRE